MNPFYQFAISMQHWATTPTRWMRKQRWQQAGQVPVVALFYHRVANEFPNPWTISCQQFEAQIRWIQRRFEIVTLQECQRRIESKFNDRPTVAITFDDGYADNARFAIPFLLERNIPFTYFVTWGNVVKQTPFQHDIDFGQPLPIDTPEMITALAQCDVEIGAHTRNHLDLGSIKDPELLYDEVITSSQELQKAIGKPVRYFAFPFGQPHNLNRQAIQLLRQHSFAGFCSAYGGVNLPGESSFHMQRLHGDPSLSRLKNWLDFSQRVLRVKRVDCDREVSS